MLLLGVSVPAHSRVTRTLSVTNGGRWGYWREEQRCAHGSYAVGFDMKIEGRQGSSYDDTALNGIKLICETMSGPAYQHEITSAMGDWGEWVGRSTCDDRHGKKQFLTSFRLQVESPQGSDYDDTSANYIEFRCRDFAGSLPEYTLSKYPGYGFWGDFGHWSYDCPLHSAICGIRTRIETPQGRDDDDTALNDVEFYCCN